MRFIFYICRTVAGISINSQLHEFFESHFLAGFCYLAQLWAGRPEKCAVGLKNAIFLLFRVRPSMISARGMCETKCQSRHDMKLFSQ